MLIPQTILIAFCRPILRHHEALRSITPSEMNLTPTTFRHCSDRTVRFVTFRYVYVRVHHLLQQKKMRDLILQLFNHFKKWNRVLKVPNFSFQRWTTFGDPEWKQLREKKCPFGIVRQVSKSNTESSRKDTLDVVHDSFHLVKAGEAERTRSIKFKQELTVS